LQKDVRDKVSVRIPADAAVILVLIPAGGKAERRASRMFINDVIVDYRCE